MLVELFIDCFDQAGTLVPPLFWTKDRCANKKRAQNHKLRIIAVPKAFCLHRFIAGMQSYRVIWFFNRRLHRYSVK